MSQIYSNNNLIHSTNSTNMSINILSEQNSEQKKNITNVDDIFDTSNNNDFIEPELMSRPNMSYEENKKFNEWTSQRNSEISLCNDMMGIKNISLVDSGVSSTTINNESNLIIDLKPVLKPISKQVPKSNPKQVLKPIPKQVPKPVSVKKNPHKYDDYDYYDNQNDYNDYNDYYDDEYDKYYK